MRWMLIAGVAASLVGATARAQSVSELREQYRQTEQMLQQAESMGVDPSLTSSLRESLEGLRQSIDEMEREQSQAAQASTAESAPAPTPAPAAPEGNLAEGVCSRFGFTEANYRTVALADGNDAQIRTMCGQAYEYYTMYRRAVGQGHPEAWRTYDAHKKSAQVVNSFWGEAKADPGSGIQPDTKTAAQVYAEQRAAAAEAEASAPKRPPQAPPCSGCVTPQ